MKPKAFHEPQLPFDKLREECGVMAIYNHSDAARLTYWGLYALQHRGQESAGIATVSTATTSPTSRAWAWSPRSSPTPSSAKLPGHLAIGHTRYSTTGDSALLNAQPISVDSTKGLIAIAHNGNLVNLGTSRARLERDGAVFRPPPTPRSSSSSSRTPVHTTLVDCIADSLSQVEGAFSIVMMTRNRIFAARDPHGFRPLSMGRITRRPTALPTPSSSPPRPAPSISSTRKYERDVEPGELIMVSEDGVTSRRYFNRESTPQRLLRL